MFITDRIAGLFYSGAIRNNNEEFHMKHNLKIIALMILIFFASQVVGLAIINQYVDKKVFDEKTGQEKVLYKDLPLNIERPRIKESQSYIYISAAIILGTI